MKNKKAKWWREVAATIFFITIFCAGRLVLIGERPNIRSDNGVIAIVLSIALLIWSLLVYLLDKLKAWLSFNWDVFMLLGGGIFCWGLNGRESDILFLLMIVIFIFILIAIIKVVYLFKSGNSDWEVCKEKLEIHYFFTHEIWEKIIVFLLLFIIIERILVPLVVA
jgi:hypothetical protein